MADNTLSFPSELMAQIESAAIAAHQTPEEWAADAMQRQLKNAHFKSILARNDRDMLRSRIKESDVPDMVHQARAERCR